MNLMNEYNEILSSDRYFDSNEKIREIARHLYAKVKDLPIIAPHGHVDPKIFSQNLPFPDPTELIITPDHYIYRMLYSQGISLESLGIPTIDNHPVEKDHRKIWQMFAENFYLFLGTPTGAWLSHEFGQVFGISERLNGDNAQKIYDLIQSKLNEESFLPRNLFNQFNIEVLTTTDAASDPLTEHKKIMNSNWDGKIIPCFRPDASTNLDSKNWHEEIENLSRQSGIEITSYKKFIEAQENRRDFFKQMGAVSTDHGVISPFAHELSAEEAEAIFGRALKSELEENDAEKFTAHMLMEMARMSTEDGLVMQLHAGSNRNHHERIYNRFGLDKGCDIPQSTEYTNNMKELLNKYGNNSDFSLIVFTLDETTYARELAPLAGHYPSMKLGPAWWFHDSIQGMIRYRQMTTETAGFFNTVGFNDDTRAFLSIPARHDLSRRVDCNFLAGLVSVHQITISEAEFLAEQLAYKLVKKAYKL